MSARRRFSWGDERGTAVAELAIVLPVFLVLMLGMLDFGKAYNAWVDQTHLANEGARLAAVNYTPPGGWPSSCASDPTGGLACYIQQHVDLTELKNGRGTSSPQYAPSQNPTKVCISFPSVGHTSPLVGDPVQVTVTTDYQWLYYLRGRLNLPLGGTRITGNAAMRLEAFPTYTAGCYQPPIS
jgi:TadE-like protein